MPEPADPLANVLAAHSAAALPDRIRCECDWESVTDDVVDPRTDHAAHVAEAMRAAFPTEYAVQSSKLDTASIYGPWPRESCEAFIKGFPGSTLVGRPGFPYHPIKEQP